MAQQTPTEHKRKQQSIRYVLRGNESEKEHMLLHPITHVLLS